MKVPNNQTLLTKPMHEILYCFFIHDLWWNFHNLFALDLGNLRFRSEWLWFKKIHFFPVNRPQSQQFGNNDSHTWNFELYLSHVSIQHRMNDSNRKRSNCFYLNHHKWLKIKSKVSSPKKKKEEISWMKMNLNHHQILGPI